MKIVLPEEQLESVSRGLADEFEGVVSPEMVKQFVHQSAEQLAREARFTTFLPILTRRAAREHLLAIRRQHETTVTT